MSKRVAALLGFLFVSAELIHSQTPGENSLVERVGDTGFVRVDVGSFGSLTAKQQELAYWLSQASIAIDPIAYDQFSRFGLRQKRLLEEVVAHANGDAVGPGVKAKIVQFTKLFWANRGNHNDITSQKFLPDFTFDELKQAAFVSQKNGAFATSCADLPPLTTPAQLNEELEALRAPLFDPNYEPRVTAKSPSGGQDIIQASSNTFYQGVTLADLRDFHGNYPLNSRLVKSKDGSSAKRSIGQGHRTARSLQACTRPICSARMSILPGRSKSRIPHKPRLSVT